MTITSRVTNAIKVFQCSSPLIYHITAIKARPHHGGAPQKGVLSREMKGFEFLKSFFQHLPTMCRYCFRNNEEVFSAEEMPPSGRGDCCCVWTKKGGKWHPVPCKYCSSRWCHPCPGINDHAHCPEGKVPHYIDPYGNSYPAVSNSA